MTGIWSDGASALLPDIRALVGGGFRSCTALQCAVLKVVSPSEVVKACDALQIESGWAAFSNSQRAQIIYWPPNANEHEDVAQRDGFILSGEMLNGDGLSFRIAPDLDSNLAMWVYGKDLSTFLSQHRDWQKLPDLVDLICETQQLMAVRESHGSLIYDVYWQATRTFGLRPRLALFMGYGALEGAER